MDERRLMGPVSGLLWLAGAGVATAGWFLPGAPHDRPGLFWGIVALTVVYSVGCATGAIPWHRASLRAHAVAVTSLQPVVIGALWLSGGQDSYMGPMLVLPMLYVAYFFPVRYAWPLGLIEVGSYASPLLTAPGGQHLLIARTLSYAVAYIGLAATIQFLKQRLVDAERHQREMAHQDPLTGLANRRAFDDALEQALAEAATGRGDGRRAGDAEPRFALLLADVDWFKQINDRFGHTTGDRVLREVAAHASAEVRSGDCLARIGGDELAVVAPGAGAGAARRLAESLRAAAAQVVPGEDADPVSLTVAFAVYPGDGTDRAALMRALDAELHAGKATRR
jgi:diguanylate cyclase (GGDEF)-like protein